MTRRTFIGSCKRSARRRGIPLRKFMLEAHGLEKVRGRWVPLRARKLAIP